MRSAVLFFPPVIRMLRNFPTSLSRYRTSGRGSRWSKNLVLGICHSLFRYQSLAMFLLRTLRPILRTALLSIRHANGIKSASDDVIAYSGQVLHTAATYEHDRMFLKIVADTGDVGRYFHSIRQPNARDFPQR